MYTRSDGTAAASGAQRTSYTIAASQSKESMVRAAAQQQQPVKRAASTSGMAAPPPAASAVAPRGHVVAGVVVAEGQRALGVSPSSSSSAVASVPAVRHIDDMELLQLLQQELSLKTDSALLHSVFFTQKDQLVDGSVNVVAKDSNSVSSEDAEAQYSSTRAKVLSDELEAIKNRTRANRLKHLEAHMQKEEKERAAAEKELEMMSRISTRRRQEQERAVHRFESNAKTVEQKLQSIRPESIDRAIASASSAPSSVDSLSLNAERRPTGAFDAESCGIAPKPLWGPRETAKLAESFQARKKVERDAVVTEHEIVALMLSSEERTERQRLMMQHVQIVVALALWNDVQQFRAREEMRHCEESDRLDSLFRERIAREELIAGIKPVMMKETHIMDSNDPETSLTQEDPIIESSPTPPGETAEAAARIPEEKE